MEKRKTLPRPAFARLYFIDREIASGKYPNTKDLARSYECGIATVSRDIEFMRDRLHAPIEYDYVHRGYWYTEKTYRLPAGFTSADDMLALGMAKSLLSLYRNTPIYDAARELLESLLAPLEDAGLLENRIIVPPVPSAPVTPEVWNGIVDALRQNRMLNFEYISLWGNGYEKRQVRPYQLLFDNGSWYLFGFAEERGDVRMFSLPRIRDISLCKETFTLPADYDFCVRNDGSYFGVYSSDTRLRFRINFYGPAALRVQERRWAQDQVIENIEDGVSIAFSSTQYGKVLEWVLSSGRDAAPLEPLELVADWQEHIGDMRKNAESVKK
jgi:predicted DNA-binding transcriptional regulator YafY